MVEDRKLKTGKDNIPVINLDESAVLLSIQAFIISTTSYRPLGTQETKPRVFEEIMAAAKVMIAIGFQLG